MSARAWHQELCTCVCPVCGDGIWECACTDLECEHECDCLDAYGETENEA